MTRRRGNLTKFYPLGGLDGWGGCSHLDCLPECWTSQDDGHCERLAQWLGQRAAGESERENKDD